MTMSISVAPASTERRISSTRSARGERPGGKSSGDGSDGDAGSLERFDGGLHKGVIDADGGDGEVQLLDTEAINQMMLQRIAGFGAQTADAVSGIVAAEGGEIHAGNSTKQPRCLILFLDGAARDVSGGSALDGAGVDADLVDPVDVERNAAIALEKSPIENHGRGLGGVGGVVRGWR